MPRKSNFKDTESYKLYLERKNEQRRAERERRLRSEIAEIKVTFRSPLPKVESKHTHYVDIRNDHHKVTDSIAQSIRKELLKRWYKDHTNQVIITATSAVFLNRGSANYTITLTSMGAALEKKWLNENLKTLVST